MNGEEVGVKEGGHSLERNGVEGCEQGHALVGTGLGSMVMRGRGSVSNRSKFCERGKGCDSA